MSGTARYVLVWLLVTLGLVSAVAVVNLLVDPYGIFDVVNVDGFNRVKSRAEQRGELFKRYNAERIRPNGLVLGNSRAEIGFDPDSDAWPIAARPVFNLALPGAGLPTAVNELVNILRYTTPRIILVGLDFVDFRVKLGGNPHPSPPVVPSQWQRFRERFTAVFTLDALMDSIYTVLDQHNPYAPSLTVAGFNPMHDYVAIAHSDGYYAMFRQRDQENAENYVRGPKTVFLTDGRPAPDFGNVMQIVTIAGQKGIPVKFVMYPYHAHTLVLFHLAGLWPAYEAWKEELVRMLGASKSNVELWDFSGFSPYASEAVPAPGDKHTQMQWYWEGGHFKSVLGKLMLARMFQAEQKTVGWGVKLTTKNLKEQIEKERAGRDTYERTHPNDLYELSRLISTDDASLNRWQ